MRGEMSRQSAKRPASEYLQVRLVQGLDSPLGLVSVSLNEDIFVKYIRQGLHGHLLVPSDDLRFRQ